MEGNFGRPPKDLAGSECRKVQGKMNVSLASPEAASERERLDARVASLMLIIQESEAKLLRRNQENETYQGTIKSIRLEKDETIKQRKNVDEHLQSLNDEITDKREVLVRLQGNLQYRKEEKINEAIRRLEYQLAANNYRVTEEIKIVQEIDRLKRSKKSLCQYLALKDELDRTKDKLNMMRNKRDALYRQVAGLKTSEEELKKNVRENRTTSDALRKEIDELYLRKRKAIADLKQAAQPLLHLRELHQPVHRRTTSFTTKMTRTDESVNRAVTVAAVTPTRSSTSIATPICSRSTALLDVPPVMNLKKICCNKIRSSNSDSEVDQVRLCNTLAAYLLRLSVTPATTPVVTPVIENRQHALMEDCKYSVADCVTVLHRHDRDECDDSFGWQIKKGRGLKKGKREKKCHINKPLSHTPEVLFQFCALGLKPPLIVGDVPVCLEKLTAKKESLSTKSNEVTSSDGNTPSPSHELQEVSLCSTSNAINLSTNNSTARNEKIPESANSTIDDEVSSIGLEVGPISLAMTTDIDDSVICDKTTNVKCQDLNKSSPLSNNVLLAMNGAALCNGALTNGGRQLDLESAFLLVE